MSLSPDGAVVFPTEPLAPNQRVCSIVTVSTEAEIVDRLLELQRRMHAHFETTAGDLGLTPPQAHAIYLFSEPRPMRSAAEAMRCDASYITHLTDDLEAKGLVERRADPRDRRVKQVALTAAGEELRSRLAEELHTDSPAVRPLDAAHRSALLDMLRTLVADP